MIRFVFSTILLFAIKMVFAQSPQVFFNNGIVYIKGLNIAVKDTVVNGHLLYYPEGWDISFGKDSMPVTFPHGWVTMQGDDGRLVAFPPSWTAMEGKDGRIIAYPYEEIITEKKIKIDTCSNPDTSKCYYTLQYRYNKYNLYYQEGKDGRGIIYTKDMFVAMGNDGRLVNIPKGWEITQNEKGRLTAYPKNWVAYSTGEKDFALPKNWEIDYLKDAPKIITGKDFIKFIYVPVQKIEVAKAIYESDAPEKLNYILYMLFNQGE